MTRRVLAISAVCVAGLLLAVLLLAAWTLGTQSGGRVLWRAVAAGVGGLSVSSVEGRVAGSLSLRGLHYETDALRLHIGSLDLRWAPARLLRGELLVEALHLGDVAYTQLEAPPPAPASEPFALPPRLSLPIAIELRDVAVRAFDYRSAPDAAPVRVDAAALEAVFREGDLSIARLFARGPLFEVDAAGRVRTEDDYPTTLTLDWQATPPGFAPLDGKLTLAGGLSSLRIEQQIAEPYAASQQIDVRDLLGDMRFDARVELAGTQLRGIGDTLPSAAVSGTLRADGSVDDLAYRADFDVVSDEFGALALHAGGGFREQEVVVDELRVKREPGGASLQLSGRADLGQARPEFTFDGDWRDLAWPLSGDARVTSASGDFSLSGHAEAYSVALSALLAAPGYTDGDLTLTGRGGREAFELTELKLEALGGYLSGNGRVRWLPDLQAAVVLEGSGLDPAVLAPAYPGDLALLLRADGGVTDGDTRATVETLSLGGSFRGRPVDLQLEGSLRDERLNLATLDARSGQTRIKAAGQVGEEIDLDWSIDSPDLGDVLPGATGTLAGEGRASGRAALPALRAELAGDAITYAGYSLARLDLAMDVDLDRAAPSQLALTVDRVLLPGGVEVSAVAINGSGNRGDHQIDLRLDSSAGAARVQLAGDLRDTHWQGRLATGEIRYGDLAAWQLMEAQPMRLGAETSELERGCWRSGDARLCFRGRRAPDAMEADFSLSAFDLAYLRPLIPPSISLDGTIEARGGARQDAAAPAALSLAINGEGMELRTGPSAEQPGELILGMEPSQISADYDAEGLLATVSLPFTTGGGVDARARVDAGTAPLTERRLQGSLELALEDLAFLGALSPEIEEISGTLSGDLAVSGSLAEPLPEGEIRLAGGRLGLLTPGLTLSDVGLRAASSDGRNIAFEGAASSGGGTLRIDGTAQLDGAGPRAAIELAGDSFEVVNTVDARVYVSPDLQLSLRESGITVNGQVLVPRAEITPQELPRSVVTTSDDEVIITGDDGAEDAVARQAVDARVRVVLGDAVSVDGFGFKARLGGAITVTQQPGQPTLGSGEVTILDGEYRAYGQGLVIDEGKILFAGGPIAQPGINVRALRRPAEGIVVGVQVRGPLENPDFNVFSEPSMTQSEQLSWLVLGRPLDGASEGESSMIAQAALALGLKGGNFLADRLGGDLGVDSIGIETGSGEAGAASNVNEAALVVGKYLSPGLYVSYGIGLFDAISTVRLEYSLSEHWKLSTESSTIASGGDVTYTIER